MTVYLYQIYTNKRIILNKKKCMLKVIIVNHLYRLYTIKRIILNKKCILKVIIVNNLY